MVPRTLPEPGTRPYYFTWAAMLRSGERVPQYDDRGRAWQLSSTPEGFFDEVVGVEIYLHPAFAAGAPPVQVHRSGWFEVAYRARKDLSLDGRRLPDYLKQVIEVRWPGLTLVGTPDDFEPGSPPAAGWRFDLLAGASVDSEA